MEDDIFVRRHMEFSAMISTIYVAICNTKGVCLEPLVKLRLVVRKMILSDARSFQDGSTRQFISGANFTCSTYKACIGDVFVIFTSALI